MLRSKPAFAAAIVLALGGPGWSQDGRVDGNPARDPGAEISAARNCLSREQRHALIASGAVVELSTAIRRAHRRFGGDVIRARLCRGNPGLVYVLTVLKRNGKVLRARVDATSGRVTGAR